MYFYSPSSVTKNLIVPRKAYFFMQVIPHYYYRNSSYFGLNLFFQLIKFELHHVTHPHLYINILDKRRSNICNKPYDFLSDILVINLFLFFITVYRYLQKEFEKSIMAKTVIMLYCYTFIKFFNHLKQSKCEYFGSWKNQLTFLLRHSSRRDIFRLCV